MRIAIYSHSIAPSIDGVCRRFTAILHELTRQGHETLLFTIESDPLDLPAETQYVTIDYQTFPTYPSKKIANLTLRSQILIFYHLAKFKPDVIHIVADGFSQMFTLAALVLRIPIVGSFHTDLIDLVTTLNAYYFQKLLIYFKEGMDCVVMDSCATTSKSFMAKLKNQGVHCEHIIHTSVDTKVFSPTKRNKDLRKAMMFGDENGFLCIYVGRISGEKRLDVMIDAIKRVDVHKGRRIYLAIVGDGPLGPKYAAMHGPEHGIYCRPKFLSHAELAEFYASSDVHVSSSEFETLGNTVLEAFACSIPVICPRTQGFLDTVDHGKNGYLFAPGNSDDAKHFLQLVLDSPELCTQLGSKGHVEVQDKTIQRVVQDLIGWYGVGKDKRAKRSVLSQLFAFSIVAINVPFSIIVLFLYTTVLSFIFPPSTIKPPSSKRD